MNSLTIEEDEFKAYMMQWQETGRNLVTLPTITLKGLELTLSIINLDNTKLLTLNRTFYSYESIMRYYGSLVDQLYDE
jgi:hypothetical protein